MRIIYKDKENFKLLVIRKGYSLNSLSLKIGRCRQFISQSLKTGTIGALAAKQISDYLDVEYNELFEIEK